MIAQINIASETIPIETVQNFVQMGLTREAYVAKDYDME